MSFDYPLSPETSISATEWSIQGVPPDTTKDMEAVIACFPKTRYYGSKRLDQRPMPDWVIGLCMPLSIEHMSQAEERAFFERTCPLPAEAVYQTVYHSLFGLYAALRESDWSTFCLALRTVQVCAWKNAERL